MLLFLLGAVCGAVISVILVNATGKHASSKPSENTAVPKSKNTMPVRNDKKVIALDIPFEVLSNVYDLSVAHPSVQHKTEAYGSGETFEYISIDCELHYNLNERKEGKRIFVFSYYDHNGNIVSHNKTTPYYLTESGIEIVHIEHYVSRNDLPKKIGISVKEL